MGQQIKTDQLPHPRPGEEIICDLTCHKNRHSADANLVKKIKILSALIKAYNFRLPHFQSFLPKNKL